MDFGSIDALIERCGAAQVIEAIAPYLTAPRKDRIEAVLAGRLPELHVACERPEDPHNASAIVRSAEALGVAHVHVVDVPLELLHSRGVTQGAFRWVHTHRHEQLDELFASLRSASARIYGATMTGALALEELPYEGPLCLLFGNEGVGLSAQALERVDGTFRIPMYGMSESLNLSVSVAISLYAVSTARRARPGQGLRGPAYVREKARYYAGAVEPRLLTALLSA